MKPHSPTRSNDSAHYTRFSKEWWTIKTYGTLTPCDRGNAIVPHKESKPNINPVK